MDTTMNQPETEKESFVETVLNLSGKSEEEARTTGAVDKADEQVEALFAEKHQTAGSPAHRAVWAAEFPIDQFVAKELATPAAIETMMQKCLDLVFLRRSNNTLLNDEGKISDETLQELGDAGYWGLLVDREYGGSEVSFTAFAKFLTKMATIDPTIAGLASVHGCIGAVDPLRGFGNEQQKKHYLPLLAGGKKLSAFALTEPCAGSDLTALRTVAVLDGDHYVVNGEKLFITNAACGRTVGLVCLVDGKPAVLITDLPDEENEHFQIVTYGLYALKQAYNIGMIFKDFRVPKENLLQTTRGDGLTIAYHGLNRGRIALCANAAGTMRMMLASMIPWGEYRKTYGEAIAKRELVRRRMGRLAGLIVGCDALVEWCSWMLDEGYRGEMECTIAKIFGSESQKEAAIELFMKTHGGRAFLHGHLFGDNVHEFLAPCIYEGEGEMLGMAYFKSLIKEHGKRFFEPIGFALHNAGIKKPNMLNPVHAWALRKPLWNYVKWRAGQAIAGSKRPVFPSTMPRKLKAHAEWAARSLQKSRLEIDSLMTKYQLSLADRQCSISENSFRIQNMVIMVATCMYAAKQEDELIHAAANVLCEDLKANITGRRPSAGYFRSAANLGKQIAAGKFTPLAGIETPKILMPYEQS
jgi:alkylation response protein AidB-like acyl-CoA dehydrogenase